MAEAASLLLLLLTRQVLARESAPVLQGQTTDAVRGGAGPTGRVGLRGRLVRREVLWMTVHRLIRRRWRIADGSEKAYPERVSSQSAFIEQCQGVKGSSSLQIGIGMTARCTYCEMAAWSVAVVAVGSICLQISPWPPSGILLSRCGPTAAEDGGASAGAGMWW